MRNHNINIILILYLFFFIFSCSNDSSTIAGGSSETETAMAQGTILTLEGINKSGITVSIYSTEYLPHINSGFVDSTHTDSNGHFYFDSLETGLYNILCKDPNLMEAVFIPNIQIFADSLINIGIHQLEKTGFIKAVGTPDIFIAFIPGTPFVDSIPVIDSLNNAQFSFENVPPGKFTITAYYSSDGNFQPDTVQIEYSDIFVISSDTTKVDIKIQKTL